MLSSLGEVVRTHPDWFAYLVAYGSTLNDPEISILAGYSAASSTTAGVGELKSLLGKAGWSDDEVNETLDFLNQCGWEAYFQL
jgi:hypothetical protein